MYKFTSQITNPNLILVRKKLSNGTCSALILMRTPVRHYADGDKCGAPLPKPKKSHPLLWGMLGATVFTGAAVVYAKSSPESRKWLASNAPWADDFIALVYQEKSTFGGAVSNKFNQATTFMSHMLFGKEGTTPQILPSRAEQNLEKDAEKAFSDKSYKLPPPKFGQHYKKEEEKIGTPEIETPATMIQTEECAPQDMKGFNVSKNLMELEHDMHENTKVAVDNYIKAAKLCESYNKALFKIVESPMEELDKKHFSAFQGAQGERDTAVAKAKEAANKARLAIETLDRMIKAGVQAPQESIAATQRYIKTFRADLAAAEKACDEQLEKSVLSDKYWGKVEAARTAFKHELQTLFPGLDLSARQLSFSGDTDMFLIYTLKQILYLQKELAEIQTIRENNLNRAIECHNEKALIEAKVEDMISKERLEKEREFMKRSLAVEVDAQRKMRDELKKQYQLQQDVLADRVRKKETELMGKFGRMVSEQVEKERVQYKKELAAMAGKLQAIEQTLKERSKAEEEARRSQSLWAAAEALLAATRRPQDTATVDNELRALEKAGRGDLLVQAILLGIPAAARDRGILTERTLREKFDQMEKMATSVALVPREGAGLPVYFLSWLQSKLLFTKFAEIPKDELENKPTDFSALDTYDIMQRARYFMEHGDLAVALKYVNLLQGAPRAAARCWSEAARRHLEIRLAAEAVMAHASVSGLLYL